jgi:PhnB protein
MASRLNPYLGFGNTARTALEFYREVFGGTLTLSAFGDFGHKEAPGADLIMHGELRTTDGFTLMAGTWG